MRGVEDVCYFNQSGNERRGQESEFAFELFLLFMRQRVEAENSEEQLDCVYSKPPCKMIYREANAGQHATVVLIRWSCSLVAYLQPAHLLLHDIPALRELVGVQENSEIGTVSHQITAGNPPTMACPWVASIGVDNHYIPLS